MNRFKRVTVGVLLCLYLSGCATVIQGGPDKIRVNSSPEGARVYLNDQPVGSTPVTVSVKHTDDVYFRIEKDGYERVTVDRGKSLSGWIFGNLIFGPLFIVGTGVDLITHNQGHYAEDPIIVELHPQSSHTGERK